MHGRSTLEDEDDEEASSRQDEADADGGAMEQWKWQNQRARTERIDIAAEWQRQERKERRIVTSARIFIVSFSTFPFFSLTASKRAAQRMEGVLELHWPRWPRWPHWAAPLHRAVSALARLSKNVPG
jgi:hypothetical protein